METQKEALKILSEIIGNVREKKKRTITTGNAAAINARILFILPLSTNYCTFSKLRLSSYNLPCLPLQLIQICS